MTAVYAYTVHCAKDDELGAVEIVFTDEALAYQYARERSLDPRVRSTSITRFTVSQLGTRHPLAVFIEGELRPRPHHGPNRLYPAG